MMKIFLIKQELMVLQFLISCLYKAFSKKFAMNYSVILLQHAHLKTMSRSESMFIFIVLAARG